MTSKNHDNKKAARLLIAEDSTTQAQQLAFLLEEQRFEVLIAKNGRQALSMIEAEMPDLIISDIVMPEMDGYTLCRTIKTSLKTSSIPFILVTSLSSPHDVFKGLDSGADNFIVKPYDESLLLSRINYLLTNRDLRGVGKLEVGIEIELSGQRHFITAGRQQILDLLISTYEQAVHLNESLEQRQQELTQSYKTLNALYGIAEGLNRCRSESEVATSAVENGLALPGVKAGWIYLLEDGAFRLAAIKGAPEGLFDGGSLCGDCACQRLFGTKDNAVRAQVLECERLAKAKNVGDLRYHASVALVADGEARGIFNLIGSSELKFSEEELRTLSGIGSQIAVALERAHLHETLERKVRKRTAALRAEVQEREQAQAAAVAAGNQLRQTNELLSAVLDSSPIAIETVDEDGRVLTWNQAAEDIFGYPAEDVIGAPDPTVTAEDEGKAIALRGAEGIIREIELKRRRKDGRLIDIRMSSAPIHHGETLGRVVLMNDVTNQKRIEEQLRQAQKMEAIGNLTGGIAHDFNNLLTILMGNIDLSLRYVNDRQEASALLNSALDACQRGADLTRQLLAFGRRQTLKPAIVDVNRLVRGMVKLLTRTLGEGVRIELAEGDAVWPVLVDAAQLDAAVLNLAVNARDAMPNGGMLTIETSNTRIDDTSMPTRIDLSAGDYVVISITDTGTGMSPEILAHIFEPFFTTKETNKGTGLGLAMVYGFVKQSGGHVTVYSEVGNGTVFRLYLPRAQHIAASANATEAAPESIKADSTVKILVVEDNSAVRQLVQRQLAGLGYQIRAAADAKQAIDIIERGSEDIDLVFSDVIMPGEMNGLKLAAEVARRWPRIRVLLTSGFPETALNKSSPEIHPTILSKPYRTEDLARSIRRVLEP